MSALPCRFTERFWHQSKYFFALADRSNDYLITFLTRDTAPYRNYQRYDPLFLQFGFLHPIQMDVNNTTHKVNRVKMLHKMHNYLFLQHHFHRSNPLIKMNSRLQYANNILTSLSNMKYSYIIQPNYCEGTLRNFDPIKSHFILSPLYAKTNRPMRTNREPSQEETQIFNHLLALQSHCNVDLYPRALAACLASDPEFLAFFRDPDNRAPDFEFEYRT